MSTGALVEAVVGVADLPTRQRFYEEALGLRVIAGGAIPAATACALWGHDEAVATVTLGRPDVPGAPRLRLMAARGPAGRPGSDLRAPGPLGIGFTTRGVQAVHERLRAAGIEWVSEPICLTPGSVGPTGPRRYEAFGRAPDGEFLVLIERLNTPTPYGTISEALGTSEPLHTSHVVPDLEAASRFMRDALGHESLMRDRSQGEAFERLLGLPKGTTLSFDMLHRPGQSTGRIVLMAFEGHAAPPASVPPLGRGLTALRYHCDDLGPLVARYGGTPVAVDSPALGRGRVLVVPSPFGTLFELWEVSR